MLFEQDFWGGTDMFGRLAPSTQERGKFFLFYSYSGISGMHRQMLHGCSCTTQTKGVEVLNAQAHLSFALHIPFAVTIRS